jgi:tetratricopeptide (TPR) repeat protein
VSRFWFGVGFDYIRKNPRAWGSLLWAKFRFFWNGYERANVENFYFHRRFPGVLGLPLPVFGVIAPLGLIGLFLTAHRWRRLWLLYGGVLTYLFTALVFYVLARYRLPVVVFLLPLAGAAVTELWSLGRRRRIAELALSLAALGLIVLFLNMPAAKDTPAGISNYYVRLGRIYDSRGDVTNAEKSYRKALELSAENQDAKQGLESIGARLDKAHR